MANLIAKFHGQEIGKIQLQSGEVYSIGRAADSAIQLPSERGISRNHLKLYEQDGMWVCETLSKFVHIQKGTESSQILELKENCEFTVGSIEFIYYMDAPAVQTETPQALEEPAMATAESPSHDATLAGPASLVPYLRIKYSDEGREELLKLEGQNWVAGRESHCEIFVNHANLSRKHFELSNTPNGFFIMDLGSSNGTTVNGIRLTPHEPKRLESGDEISIKNLAIIFEVRDPGFANRVRQLATPALLTQQQASESRLPALYDPTIYQGSPEASPPKRSRPKSKGLNPVRMVLGAIALTIVVIALLPGKEKEKTNRDPATQTAPAGVSKEQQTVIKDAFNLARNLYVQGKYALCLTELAKIHELVPIYENSKELQTFCEQGQELQRRAEDVRRKDQERQQIETQIGNYVDSCKSRLAPNATLDEARTCLAPAMELNPEHPAILEILQSAQNNEAQRAARAQEQRKLEAQISKGNAHFERAISTYKTGNLKKAAEQLEEFLSKSYPGSTHNKDEAKRTLASIKQEISTKVAQLVLECKGLVEKNRYKDAYLSCDKALKVDAKNEEALALRQRSHSELRREMKSIYEDSVLEESLGNVDSAKEKWKKIIQENISTDEYTKKAKSKLASHGVEL